MKRFLIIVSLCFSLFTQNTYAYPLQIKVDNKSVEISTYIANNKRYFAASDVCTYLNMSATVTNGIFTITNFDGWSKSFDTYSTSPDFVLIDSRAYISADVLRSLNCTVAYYETANTYNITYVPTPLNNTTSAIQVHKPDLFKAIYSIDFTKCKTVEDLHKAFSQALNKSEQSLYQELRVAVQNHIENLQGTNNTDNTEQEYLIALLNVADVYKDTSFMPEDVKYYKFNSMAGITIDDSLTNEQSIDNIVKNKNIKTNSTLYQVARFEITARNVKTSEVKYRKLRDYLYLKLR